MGKPISMTNMMAFLMLICMPVYPSNQEMSDTLNKVKFTGLPIIGYDATYNVNLGLVTQAFYKINPVDTISPTSYTGLLGLYTLNGSFGAGAIQKFYINEDRWRITLAGGFGGINFQFWQEFPIVGGLFIGFNTKATFATGKVERRIVGRLYGGIDITYAHTTTTYDLPEWVPDDLRSEQIDMHNFGYQFIYDNREHQYNPYGGYYLAFKHSLYPGWLNNGNSFHNFAFTYNHYYQIPNERHILATRIRASISVGDVPFQGQNVVGRDDIRGYTSGKYRNNQVYSIQAEYRWRFYKRLGVVGFFGLATATENLGALNESELLPGGGIGFRYMMLPSERINVGFDVALGKEDWGLYFRIGEAFGR